MCLPAASNPPHPLHVVAAFAGQLIDSMPWDEGLRSKVLGANACTWMGRKYDDDLYFLR